MENRVQMAMDTTELALQDMTSVRQLHFMAECMAYIGLQMVTVESPNSYHKAALVAAQPYENGQSLSYNYHVITRGKLFAGTPVKGHA